MSFCPRCAQLRDEAEELRERLRQMKESLAPSWVEMFPMGIWLAPQERTIFSCLVAHEVAAREHIYQAITSDRPEPWPEPKIVDVHIHNLRKKLGPSGVKIRTVWGVGYRLIDRHRFNPRRSGATT